MCGLLHSYFFVTVVDHFNTSVLADWILQLEDLVKYLLCAGFSDVLMYLKHFFLVHQVDGDGDGLQPLPQMTRSSMQRSYSSHALGQLRHPAPPSSENGMNSRNSQVDRSGGLTSPGARLQPSLAEFQSVGMRPMMRRVYSAGDIQVI